jgi:hypothetical protein
MADITIQRTSYATTYIVDQCRAVLVHKRDEAGDYRVKLYYHATRLEDADYFTDDKGDADNTAQAMCRPPCTSCPHRPIPQLRRTS